MSRFPRFLLGLLVAIIQGAAANEEAVKQFSLYRDTLEINESARMMLKKANERSKKAFTTFSAPIWRWGIAQLVSVLPCHGRGCGFESRRLT